MRILTWNINGIRTLPQYHPWNTFKSCEAMLDHLQASIICFQEMKTSRPALDRNVGLPGPYHAFFSFPTTKGGYSGVAVYTDSRKAIPLKAEEGLSGTLQPKPPLSQEERISAAYPKAHELDLMADDEGYKPADLTTLDSEGRALVLDFGLFVLINLYCPNEASEERLVFKMNYHIMLQERVRELMAQGREVMVVGDINICATLLDHGEGHLNSRSTGFYDHPARVWFRDWLEPKGCMIDFVRKFWPDRKGMYTCWNTKISARETNYGARIDYILGTPGLLPWVKHGDIQALVKGSDHCPVYVDLHDEITLPSGATLTLREAMRMDGPKRESPRLASMYWDEFSGKQTLLSTFFRKRTESPPLYSGPTSTGSAETVSSPCNPQVSDPSHSETVPTPPIPSLPSSQTPPSSHEIIPSSSHVKRRKSITPPKHSKKHKPGQAKLSTYFGKVPAPKERTQAGTNARLSAKPESADVFDPSPDDLQLGPDPWLSSQPFNSQDSSNSTSALPSKAAWSHLMAPIQPPKCTVHGEPTKEFTVNKSGPNKGKNFFICARPVGPGYDKGWTVREREEVDPQYKCNFFKWSSDVKREALKKLPR